MLIQKTFFGFGAVLICLLIATFASAEEEQAAQTDEHIQQAEAFVHNLGTEVFSTISDSARTDEEKKDYLFKFIEEHVNTDWMSLFVLSKYGRQLDNGLKPKYQELYRQYISYSYIPRFKEYANRDMEILRSVKSGDEVVVQTSLSSREENSEEPPFRVDFRLRKDAASGKFKIVDFVGEGVSLITTQRSDFAGLLSRKGVKHFIDRLQARVEKLKIEVG